MTGEAARQDKKDFRNMIEIVNFYNMEVKHDVWTR
jgi:hypothetical protein